MCAKLYYVGRAKAFSSVATDSSPSIILTVVSGIQEKSDICQALKNLSSNLTASRKHHTEKIISQTYVLADKMTKY